MQIFANIRVDYVQNFMMVIFLKLEIILFRSSFKQLLRNKEIRISLKAGAEIF